MLETGFNFRPGALIPGIRLEIGQPRVKKGTFLGRDREVLFRERIPQRLDQLQRSLGLSLRASASKSGFMPRVYSRRSGQAPLTPCG